MEHDTTVSISFAISERCAALWATHLFGSMRISIVPPELVGEFCEIVWWLGAVFRGIFQGLAILLCKASGFVCDQLMVSVVLVLC